MTELLNLTDESLVAKSKEGDLAATNILLDRYKPLVRKKANALFLVGAEMEDLIQEGMIGLFTALKQYDEKKDASFKTYASICVNGQMHHAITAANRNKHMPLNGYVSLNEEHHEGEGDTLLNLLMDIPERDPESLIIDKENVDGLLKKIKDSLSQMEWQVFSRYISGQNYKTIAESLDKAPKSIDNALNRIKRKISQLL